MPQVSRFNKLIETAEKKNVTPLAIDAEEVEVYEEKFRTALESLKATVVEEKQDKIIKSDRVRRKNRFVRSNGKDTKVVSSGAVRHRRPAMKKALKQPAKS